MSIYFFHLYRLCGTEWWYQHSPGFLDSATSWKKRPRALVPHLSEASRNFKPVLGCRLDSVPIFIPVQHPYKFKHDDYSACGLVAIVLESVFVGSIFHTILFVEEDNAVTRSWKISKPKVAKRLKPLESSSLALACLGRNRVDQSSKSSKNIHPTPKASHDLRP